MMRLLDGTKRVIGIVGACSLAVTVQAKLKQPIKGFPDAPKKEGTPYVPADKQLDPTWVKSLLEKGERKVYRGEELKYIAMPCGGIGAGQVGVSGDGRLCFQASIFNKSIRSNYGHGNSTGYHYLNPAVPVSDIENSFSVSIKEPGSEAVVLPLSGEGFDDIRFVGEYPRATLDFRNTGARLPVVIQAEVFSPFIPLDVRSSANPLTVVKYSVKNTGDKPVDVSIAGWMKNIAFPEKGKVRQVNRIRTSKGVRGVSFEMEPTDAAQMDELLKHPQLGGFSLSILDADARCSVSSSGSADFIGKMADFQKGVEPFVSDTPEGGSVGSPFRLAPNESRDVTFLVTWYFPNYVESYNSKWMGGQSPGWVGRIYDNWYDSPFDVAEYAAAHFDELYDGTSKFLDTYYDSTLPYWLANRITMPVGILAAGNTTLWKNGRMYGYEGIGFCLGTCGHVYNFATAASKLFPELERSVRLKQDFSRNGPYSGFSKSGRINFRGHNADEPDAKHAYASDAQSGYVLKAYREHLMSVDNTFLDAVWDEVKLAMGYQIFKDGAEVGMNPNGVLEGLQTFWDPMWYGPNPYNNTLYLAALRAAEEMAKIKGEPDLAARYRNLFEQGQRYMNEKMWNGECYIHLYPSGFPGRIGSSNGVQEPGIIERNAMGYVQAFNRGEPNYYTSSGCDAQQLFGQNWAQQLGLGYILPRERCRTAAESIFRYNWTPDIATVYDYQLPAHRMLAVSGEAAMINGSWQKGAPAKFENTHDKYNIWTGLEYEAACDMISAGLVKEGLIVVRSIHDRYNGTKRNPWNEIEGSDYYSRSMQSWNVLLSVSGFTYDGPAGKIGFAPRMTPENFKCFFSAAEGWGSYEQSRTDGKQRVEIQVEFGQLLLKQLCLEVPGSQTVSNVNITLGDRPIEASFVQKGEGVTVLLKSRVTVSSDASLNLEIR